MTALLLIALAAAGNLYTETFDAANTAYMAGDFALAAQRYEDLVAEGTRDAAVFYNLGNAYYRLGQLGLAMANYERALHLEPGHAEASDNLAHALSRTKMRVERPQPPIWEQNLFFWHYSLAHGLVWWLAVVAWGGFWFFLGLHLWRRMPYGVPALALLLILACAFGWSAWRKANPEPMAVAFTAEAGVPLRYGPGEANDVVTYGGDGGEALLYDGDRLRVETRTAGWARVSAADGRRGWVQERSLAPVTPPFTRPQIPDAATHDDDGREGRAP